MKNEALTQLEFDFIKPLIKGDRFKSIIDTGSYIITGKVLHGADLGEFNHVTINIVRKSDDIKLLLISKGDARVAVEEVAKIVNHYFWDDCKEPNQLITEENVWSFNRKKDWVLPNEPVLFKIAKKNVDLRDLPTSVRSKVGWSKAYVKQWGSMVYFPWREYYSGILYKVRETTLVIPQNGVFLFKDKNQAISFKSRWSGYIIEA